MKRLFILVLSVLVLGGCGSEGSEVRQNSKLVKAPEAKAGQPKAFQKGDMTSIINADFALNGFGFGLTLDDIKKTIGSDAIIEDRMETNRHDKTKNDKLTYVRKDNTFFILRESGGNQAVEKAYTDSDMVSFKNGIHIGMSKKVFAEKMSYTETLTDFVEVSNIERTVTFRFNFSGDKLANVAYMSYMD